MIHFGRFALIAAISLTPAAWVGGAAAQETSPAPATTTTDGVTQAAPTSEKPDPLKRRLSDKERFKQQHDIKQELKGSYKTWADQDVRWIITDEELQAFKSLSNDEERDQFIEQFWLRRNPNPDSPENEFREQHYQRIA